MKHIEKLYLIKVADAVTKEDPLPGGALSFIADNMFMPNSFIAGNDFGAKRTARAKELARAMGTEEKDSFILNNPFTATGLGAAGGGIVGAGVGSLYDAIQKKEHNPGAKIGGTAGTLIGALLSSLARGQKIRKVKKDFESGKKLVDHGAPDKPNIAASLLLPFSGVYNKSEQESYDMLHHNKPIENNNLENASYATANVPIPALSGLMALLNGYSGQYNARGIAAEREDKK